MATLGSAARLCGTFVCSLGARILEFAILMAIVVPISVECLRLWPDTNNGLAAWVQAFGSIGAIIGGLAAVRLSANRSALHARAERRQRELGMVRASYEIVLHVSHALYSVVTKLKETSPVHPIGVTRLEDLQQSLLVLISKDLPPGALTEVLHAKRELAYALADLRARKEDPMIDQSSLLKKARGRHRRTKEARATLRALVQELRQE